MILRLVRNAAIVLVALVACAAVSHAQTPSNVALASAGGVATASSTLSGHPVTSVNNDERTGGNYNNGLLWVDGTPNVYPDWVQINFSGAETIERVVLYSMQDNYTNPVEPTDTLTFSLYGVTGFTVQTWDGAAWVTQATVTGNNLAKRSVAFAPVTTDRIRVNVTNTASGYSYITEIEAWSPSPPDVTPPSVPTGLAANPVSSLQVNLSWTASTDNVGVTGYKVYRDGALVGSPAGTSFNDSGLTITTLYSYTVAACDAANNCSAQSGPITATTLAVSPSRNVALASAGGVASASSMLSGHPVTSVNNDERTGGNYSNGLIWVDSTPNVYPDWVQINFSGAETIDRAVLYTMQDNYTTPVEPTNTLTFSAYGVTGFTVQTWDGAAWVTQATVTGNNLVKRSVTFTPVTTDRMRINVTNTPTGYSYITEIAAWTPVVVIAASTIAKTFAPASIIAGGTSTLTFSLGNPNATALTNVNFTDALANMSVSSAAIGGTCTGVANNPALAVGATSLNLTVPILPAGGCTVTVQVASSTIGTNPNTASGVTSAQTPTAGPASNTANLTVAAAYVTPTIATSFEPASIAAGGNSTITFTLGNSNAMSLTNANFTDTLTNINVSSAAIGGTCAGVTSSPALAVGATSLNLAVPSLPAGGCTVTVQVTSLAAGTNPNTASGVTTAETPAGAASNTANLTVGDQGFYYVHADQLGTPRAITRPSDNALVWQWDNSEPFGNSAPNENPSGLGTFVYNLRLGGWTYFDAETGTLYNTNRDLDPLTGRYLQSDPIGLLGGLSTYGYVSGNPLLYIDPFGLSAECEVAVTRGYSILGWKACGGDKPPTQPPPSPGGKSPCKKDCIQPLPPPYDPTIRTSLGVIYGQKVGSACVTICVVNNLFGLAKKEAVTEGVSTGLEICEVVTAAGKALAGRTSLIGGAAIFGINSASCRLDCSYSTPIGFQ